MSMQSFMVRAEYNLDAIVKGSVRSLTKAIIKDTPVDTAVLKNNWNASLGSKDMTVTKEQSAQGLNSLKSLDTTLAKYKAGNTIYVTNAVHYGFYIEYLGHSQKKAPNGMMRINLMDFKKHVNRAKRALR